MVTVKDETLIFQQDGEDRHRVTLEEMATTQKAYLWFSGPVKESFPLRLMPNRL